MFPLVIFGKKTDMSVLCNNELKMVAGSLAVLLSRGGSRLPLAVMLHHPCFTVLNPLGYQATSHKH